MIWIYLIAFILYIIGFALRSCLYETNTNSWRDVSIAKEDPQLRKRVETPMWHIIIFIILFPIPIANVAAGIGSILWGLSAKDSQFHLYSNNSISRILGKIVNFLTKSIWQE